MSDVSCAQNALCPALSSLKGGAPSSPSLVPPTVSCWPGLPTGKAPHPPGHQATAVYLGLTLSWPHEGQHSRSSGVTWGLACIYPCPWGNRLSCPKSPCGERLPGQSQALIPSQCCPQQLCQVAASHPSPVLGSRWARAGQPRTPGPAETSGPCWGGEKGGWTWREEGAEAIPARGFGLGQRTQRQT